MRDLRLIGYSTGNFGKNLLLSGTDVTLLFLLTDLLGISPAVIGPVMLLVFFGDLLFDIGAGYLASWGQRHGLGYRSLIVIGAVPCGAAFALLYSLPMLGARQIGVLAATLLLFRAAYAIIDVPHNSLLARVARDSRARGRTSGYRLFFSSVAGIAIATILIPAVEMAAGRAMPGMLSILGISAGLLFILSMLLAAWSSRDELGSKSDCRQGTSRIPLVPNPDRVFAAVAIIGVATGFAMPMFVRMALYLSSYVLDHPGFASEILLATTLGQFLGVLLWTNLVRFADKTKLLALGHLVAAGGIILFAMMGARPELLIAAAALAGVGLAGVYMLPWAILADIVDFAEFRYGERRETAAFATFLVIVKASGAASIACISWALGTLGYVAGTAQSPSVILAMKALAYGVPVVGGIVSISILLRLSVGHHAHARVLRALDARRTRIVYGSSGSKGSVRVDDRPGRNASSLGESRLPMVPG